MTHVLVAAVALALLVFLGAHASILGALVMHRPRYRAAVAFAIPPLAPYWGWRAGLQRRVYAWAIAIVLYTVGVAVLTR
jgi:hypothetical protein